MFKSVLVFIILLSPFYVEGQIMIARSVDLNPFVEKTGTEQRVLGATYFSAEAGRGFFSTEGEQAWNIKFQAFIEFYRWGNRAVLGLSLSHELHANPYNSIRFNPRGALWNESITYYRQLKKLSLQLGLNHRCRHDIDNIDPARSGIPRAGYEPLGRVLVMTSLNISALSEEQQLSEQLSLRLFGRTDIYFYQEDSRRPSNNQELSWNNIPANAIGGFLLEYRHAERWKTYTRHHLNYILFNEEPGQLNYRSEAGLSLIGDKALGSFFIAWERYFDDVSRPYPQPSTVLYLGLRANSNTFF